MIDDQEWFPLKGWETEYTVQKSGAIRNNKTGKIIGSWKSPDGYSRVRLARPSKDMAVHRLIALNFVPNPEGLPYVNHKDFNKDNNSASNLEWCTHQQNMKHYWNGMRERGVLSKRRILLPEEVKLCRKLYADGLKYSSIASILETSYHSVWRVCKNYAYKPEESSLYV